MLFSTTFMAKSGSLTIAIPDDVRPETVRIYIAVSGDQTFVSAIRTNANVRQYKIFPLDKSALPPNFGKIQTITLLMFVPGYRTVTQYFGKSQLETIQTFRPSLASVSAVPISGQLVNSLGISTANASVVVLYPLTEAAEFFGFSNANFSPVMITSMQTDSNGSFSGTIPNLADDPFFAKFQNGRFRLAGRLESGSLTVLEPNSFGIQRNYGSVTLKATAFAKVTGQLSDEFIRSLKIPNYLKSIRNRDELAPSTIRLDLIPSDLDESLLSLQMSFGYDAQLRSNGTFTAEVPPGEYNLNLRYQPHYQRNYVKVPVERGIVLKENEQHRISK